MIKGEEKKKCAQKKKSQYSFLELYFQCIVVVFVSSFQFLLIEQHVIIFDVVYVCVFLVFSQPIKSLIVCIF